MLLYHTVRKPERRDTCQSTTSAPPSIGFTTIAALGVLGHEEPPNRIVVARTGYYHTCGIKTNGTALCWGYDNYGQVSGTSCCLFISTSQPPGDGAFSQISAGQYHTCGIKTDGSALCWGYDYYGQVDGTPTSTNNYSATGPPPGGGTFTQISAGLGHTCGLKTDGTVLCWGDDYNGQVDGSPNTTFPYETTGSPPGGGTFTQISAGYGDTCGIKSNGSLLCWGYDAYGQLDGSPNVSTASGAPSGLGTVTRVTAGGRHTCALKTNGSVLCWGDNTYSQLGTIVSGTDTGTPPGGGSYAQLGLSSGQSHTCRMNPNGSIYCTGDDTQGQLDGTPSTTTHSATLSGSYVQVSAGQYHTCALTNTRTVKCWGDGATGMSTPVSGIFTQIASGGGHSCGLRPDGSDVCWG